MSELTIDLILVLLIVIWIKKSLKQDSFVMFE